MAAGLSDRRWSLEERLRAAMRIATIGHATVAIGGDGFHLLSNAELYLRPRYRLSRRNIAWAWRRRDGLAATVAQQLARFAPQGGGPGMVHHRSNGRHG